RTFALRDGRIFLTKRCENLTEQCAKRCVVRTLAHHLLSHNAGAIERGLGFRLVAFVIINETFKESFWTSACMRIQYVSGKLFHRLQSCREFPLQDHHPHSSGYDQTT